MPNASESAASKSRSLTGVLPVFQTPFYEDESIDFDTLAREIDWLFDRGASGIVMAMVSETLRLDTNEREELAAAACRFANGRGSVVISVGGECGRIAERYTRHAADVGADAVMAIPPISVAADESELLRYYERIIRAAEIVVIVQDASGYVGRPMSIAMQAQLLKEFGDRVQYKPEATPIGPRLSALRDATDGKAKIFEGSGGIALVDSYRRGIVGTMPGAEIIEAIVALWNALVDGNQDRVNRIGPLVGALVALQTSLDGFLAVEKYLLHKQGLFANRVIRGPVAFKLDDETRHEVDRLYELLMSAVKGK